MQEMFNHLKDLFYKGLTYPQLQRACHGEGDPQTVLQDAVLRSENLGKRAESRYSSRSSRAGGCLHHCIGAQNPSAMLDDTKRVVSLGVYRNVVV